ncbi:TIGR02300 family protein [Lichenicoccus roseus]|uniref:TIGR02300 family protein n=1 Tax=Lichenicoccus roseus TaxID=2683649 RepID=A0A5R9JB98_9PROT|nr:TIGR02300 family protein [Lichenicoccus roseus]TLU74023.1 TIGR02300 family protein [Lichenicoccus roseus]
MAKPELGMKRVCVSCSARFYDLTKVPAVCPKCGTEQPLDQPRARRAAGNVTEDRRPKKVVPELDEADPEAETPDEESEDDDVIEDTADLDDDADAIGSDIEVETDRDEHET